MVGTAGYRWVVLAVGSAAQGSTAAYFLGLAAVAPALRQHFGLSLAGVGALIGVISVGLVATLIAWGTAADRFGERGVMTAGLLGAAAALGAAALVADPIAAGALLLLAGAAGASVNAASGRAVLTWFPTARRGLAMAVRQTSVPVGAALAAVALPPIAESRRDPDRVRRAGRRLPGWWRWRWPAGCASRRASGPSGRPAWPGARTVFADRRLLRLSLAGLLLVVPQFLGSVFLVEVLHSGAGHGAVDGRRTARADPGARGRRPARQRRVVRPRAVGSVRCASWPGRSASGSRWPRPTASGPAALVAAVLVPAAALAISWNGLVFTAAGEFAPPGRAATAMAVSNTANYVGAAATPVLGGLVAELAGWPAMLALGTIAAAGALLALHRLPGAGTGRLNRAGLRPPRWRRAPRHTGGATSHSGRRARYGGHQDIDEKNGAAETSGRPIPVVRGTSHGARTSQGQADEGGPRAQVQLPHHGHRRAAAGDRQRHDPPRRGDDDDYADPYAPDEDDEDRAAAVAATDPRRRLIDVPRVTRSGDLDAVRAGHWRQLVRLISKE